MKDHRQDFGPQGADRMVLVIGLVLAFGLLGFIAERLATVFADTHYVLAKPFWTCTEWDGTRSRTPTEATCTQWTSINLSPKGN